MNAIVIRRILSQSELNEIKMRFQDNEECIIHSDLSLDLPFDILPENHMDEKRKQEINFNVMNQLKDLGELDTNGTKLADLLKFENTSIWYYHKFRIYFDTLELMYQLEEMIQYSMKYDTVTCFGLKYPGIISPYLPANVALAPETRKNGSSIRKMGRLVKYFVFLFLRSISNFSLADRYRNKKHLVLDVALRQFVVDINTQELKIDNFVIGYLLDHLGRDYVILSEAFQFNLKKKIPFSNFKVQGKTAKTILTSEEIMFRGFLSPGRMMNSLKIYRGMYARLKQVSTREMEQVQSILVKMLAFNFNSTFFYLLRYKIYDRFFKAHSFKTITTTDENSPGIRAILDAARNNGMKTIGIQHGNIHELHPAYMFSGDDYKRGAMTDFTMIWGQYYKDLLREKGHYPDNSLVITGQIRTDIIPHLNGHITPYKSSGNGNSGGRIIVFASQPQQDVELRKRAAYDVFNAVKGLPDCRLVFKLHPAEKDPEYYQAIAEQTGISQFEILSDVDLYLLINQSFAVITCFSTVGMEVAYFKKPLIVLDHLKQDIQNYCKEGIGVQVADAVELNRVLSDFLSGSRRIDEEKYDRFIKKYAYKIDGKATIRTLDFISSFA